MCDKIKGRCTNEPKRIWRQENNPYRSLVFWGWNNENEPSFLILYGVHKFKEEKSYYVDNSDIERFENVLCDDVTYTSYVVFNGRDGHLPSFEAVNIVEDGGYYNRNIQDEFPKMYYKKDSRSNGWSRNLNNEGTVKEYRKFDNGRGVTIPYFDEISYLELVRKVTDSNITFENFKFAENPNEILKLTEDLKGYYELLCVMMSDKNLYVRKKNLTQLLECDADEEIYKYIFKLGSTELISGLFLECAKRNIDSFIDEAEYICKEDIHYADDSYVEGLKRCAEIYLNAVIKERRKEREKWIYDNLEKIDLNIIKIDNKEVPKGKTLNGAKYRKLSLQGKFLEYEGHYESGNNGRWEYVETRVKDRYKKGPFNDGVVFDLKAFKNILQEAEAYNMAGIIGKIAYYLDAPRLHYYFKGNRLNRELNYYKKYVRRIIEYYGEKDHERFMEAMKLLLTSYTENDFLCKFKGNFQFNYFIKNLLYCDFKEKPPTGWDNWSERSEWMTNDQLVALQGRYEVKKEIWDNHLEDVLYIASNAHINTIFKACYFILKESERTSQLIEKMNYEELIKLTMTTYEPLAQMFMEVLEDKLNNEETFDFNIMLALINNENEGINELGVNYFNRTDGCLTCNNIVELMFLDNLEKWTEYINSNISSIELNNYDSFVKVLINADDKFKNSSVKLPKEITDTLSLSVNKITEITEEQKSELVKYVINSILEKGSMESFIESYLEEVIFALSYPELKEILKDFQFNYKDKKLSNRNNMIINLIGSIMNNRIPSDSAIIGILETGTSKMLKTLFEIININEDELIERYSTMLIFFESDVEMLNKKSIEIFNKMNEECRVKMHKIIIDSPVKKVYSFGIQKLKEIYGEFVPEDFILHMLEHTSAEVKVYISNKADNILNSLGEDNEDLFMYYVKTLLLLPNKVRKNKDSVYDSLYKFALKYKDRKEEVENLLLDMGGSNIIKDSEKALVTLAKIRKEAAI